MTKAEILVIAEELGYSVSGSTKAAVITSFLAAQTAAHPQTTP